MEKIVFKNHILNIITGVLLIVAAIVGYLLGYIEEYLPVIIGAVLILLSAKRFIFTFKKTKSKNATLILVLEFILDLVFAGLMIYLKGHVELFVGLIIYTRGVAYLVINYVATRKVNLVQYLINIGYVTLGTFLIFSNYDSVTAVTIAVSVLLLLFGAVYLQAGVRQVVAKEKQEEAFDKKQKELKKKEKEDSKSEKKIVELETKVKEVEKEQKKIVTEKKDLEKIVNKIEQKKAKNIDYAALTLAELKVIAKERNLTGVSSLKKADLVDKLILTEQK